MVDEQVLVLGAEDLRFTSEETAILRQRLGGDASRDTRAEGWVAGILLGGAPRQLGAADGSLVDTYVQREVLAPLSLHARRWLEALAVLDTITPERATRLLGDGPWPARLAVLADRCPFLVADASGSYRLHTLVREALTRRLRRASPNRARRLWAAVRSLAEQAGDTAAAVNAYHELGDIEAAVALVTRTVDDAIRAGRWTPALGTLALLPERLRQEHPDLALAEAHALVQSGRPAQARQVAEAVLEHGGRTGIVGTQLRALVELANIARYTGDVEAAQDWLTAADHLLLTASLPGRERRLLEGRVLGLRGVCAAVSGQVDAARAALESAERVLLPEGTSRELAVIQFNLGTLCVRTGDYAAARTALASSSSHWRQLRDRGMLATTQLVLGNLQLRTGDLDAAFAMVSRAIESARLAGALRTEAHGLATLGALQRGYGRLGDAAGTLDTTIRVAQEIAERELLVRALTQRAEVAILGDDIATARELLARAHAEAQRLESRVERAIVARALGRLLLAEQSGYAAIEALHDALRDGGEAWGPDERLVAMYWLGKAHLDTGQFHLAESVLRQALQLAAEVGGGPVLAGPAAEDCRLLQYGRQIGIEPAAIGEIERLAARRRAWSGAVAVTRASGALADAPRVEVRMFGSLLVHLEGLVVDPGGKRDRARELLALLALHPAGLPSGEIAEILYPEMDPRRAQHNVRMAVYLLRQLLRSKSAVRYATLSYGLAPQLDLWVDTRAFDAATKGSRGTVGAPAVRALEDALELYRAPLLADAGWAWIAPFREGYARRATEAALRLSELLASTDLARSDAVAEHALALEPDNEAAFERLVRNAETRRDGTAREALLRRYPSLASRLGIRARTGMPRAM